MRSPFLNVPSHLFAVSVGVLGRVVKLAARLPAPIPLALWDINALTVMFACEKGYAIVPSAKRHHLPRPGARGVSHASVACL